MINTAKEIYETIKELRDLAKKYRDEKMSEKVVIIQERLFDLREEMESLREENNELKRSIKIMQDVSSIESDLELTDKGYYIRKTDRDQEKAIKYCAACWQNYGKLMPYVRTIGRTMQCCNCHGVIQ